MSGWSYFCLHLLYLFVLFFGISVIGNFFKINSISRTFSGRHCVLALTSITLSILQCIAVLLINTLF